MFVSVRRGIMAERCMQNAEHWTVFDMRKNDDDEGKEEATQFSFSFLINIYTS